MNDIAWPKLSYYVIHYEKLKKSHAGNREGSIMSIMTIDVKAIPFKNAQGARCITPNNLIFKNSLHKPLAIITWLPLAVTATSNTHNWFNTTSYSV